MEQKFSRKLKEQLIDYFKNNHKIEITSGQAEIYLDSLADFYIIISKKEKSYPRPSKPAPTAG